MIYDYDLTYFRMEGCRKKQYDQASEQQKLLDEITRTELRADQLERSDLELEQEIASLEFAIKEQRAERKVILEGRQRTNVSFPPPFSNLSQHYVRTYDILPHEKYYCHEKSCILTNPAFSPDFI